MEFGESIRKIREEKNLTQQQMADRLYVSRQAISNWENDKNLPDLLQVIEIAKTFDVSLDELILGGGKKMNRMTEKLIGDSTTTTRTKRNNTLRTIWMILILSGVICLFIRALMPETIGEDGMLQEAFFLVPAGFGFVLLGMIILIVQLLTVGYKTVFKKEKERSNVLSFFICLMVLLMMGGLLGLLISGNSGRNLTVFSIIAFFGAALSGGVIAALAFVYKK